MKELLEKYKDNRLTPEELLRLRAFLDEMPEEQIMEALNNIWNEPDEEIPAIFTAEDIARIKSEIDAERLQYDSRRKFMYDMRKWLQRAAIWLLPVFVCATAFLLYNRQTSQADILVATAVGEKASVVLPDGTKVQLNAESELRYNPSDFAGSERQINFKGEAFFDVAKQHGNSFSVKGMDFDVRVLGTKFNVTAYDKSTEVVVSLEEGSVEFVNSKNNERMLMKPGDISLLDRITGSLKKQTETLVADNMAWMRNELVFNQAQLPQVLDSLSRYYGVSFKIGFEAESHMSFTGVLPTNDLKEVLDIIESVYHVTAMMNGREIVLK